MSLYAWVLLVSLLGPLLFSFDKRISYYKKWPALFLGIFINGILFISWDSWFARTGVWGFNPEYVWRFRWLHLPLEEWLFFLVIPFSSVFIYTCVKYYSTYQPLKKWKQPITIFFFILTFTLALLNTDKAYTFYNCLVASLLLLIHLLFLKPDWMGYFWMAYLFHLIPFFIVNGILTGMATPEPVVWYNNAENLGIRVITIPLEDFIYAMTCLLIPITVMEMVIGRPSKSTISNN